MTQIDFYILPQADPQARLAFVARLAEKILASHHQLVIATAGTDQSNALSEQLWASRPVSFIAHQVIEPTTKANDPVLICAAEPPAYCHDVIINLTDGIIEKHFSRFHRLLEVVIQEPTCLAQSRSAYQFYKSRGYPIRSHNV
ncbi:DNA polymerase III subunit chi [Halioxenophilus sp. WMMB6]|uniref:DNA polymerase III subunit chi n=1 Tax=Halioxenophilus sp. WMMB6 TaxID=3073815 RepID=UPI00295F09DE|nr:DNA polymerase III subunit chi [Halioxenophilus sp. WMMB6]